MTQFIWVGGRPSLDLCNTVTPDGDLLTDPGDVVEWLAEAGCSQPDSTCNQDVERVRAMRDALRRAFVNHDAANVADVVSEWLTVAPGRLEIDRSSLQPNFCPDVHTCECVFVPVLLDAIDLAREEIDRVRECASDACTMIYLDSSRNRSRRWCAMERCGARAKAHAYYERKRRQV